MQDDRQEREAPESDEDRRFTNIFLLVAFAVLVGVGVWIANVMIDTRKIQDCVAQGRRNCAPIEVPARDAQ
jgi:hypothetical protein